MRSYKIKGYLKRKQKKMISEKLLNKIFTYFIILIVILSSLMFLIFVREANLENVSYSQRPKKKEVSLAVVSGALFLKPFKFDVSMDSLKDEIEVAIIEKRPDVKAKEEKLEIKLKKISKTLKINENEKFYLAVDKNGNFEFSETKTPLTIFLKVMDKKHVKVVSQTDLVDFVKGGNSKTNFFILEPIDFISSNKDLENRDDFKLLVSSKWFSKDELLVFSSKQNIKEASERLEIDGKILHLKLGDILVFKDGSWQKAKSFENTQSYIIAKIKSVDSKILEIEAWDEKSNKYIFALPIQPKQGFSIRTDQFVSSVRKRTITHISCQIEKQRVILKEKDILIKKDGRWRLLKKDIDFDEIKNEELFYFDKIESKNNKNFLVGYLFNPMRTNFQKIESPILSVAGQRNSKKRIIR